MDMRSLKERTVTGKGYRDCEKGQTMGKGCLVHRSTAGEVVIPCREQWDDQIGIYCAF